MKDVTNVEESGTYEMQDAGGGQEIRLIHIIRAAKRNAEKLTFLPEETEYGMVATSIHVGPYWPIRREQQDSRVPDLPSCQENHDIERCTLL